MGVGGHSSAWMLEDSVWCPRVVLSSMCVFIKHLYPVSQLTSLKMTWNSLVFQIPDHRCALPVLGAKDPTQSTVCLSVPGKHYQLHMCVPGKHYQLHCLPSPSDVTMEVLADLHQKLLFSSVWCLRPEILAVGWQAGGSGPALVI